MSKANFLVIQETKNGNYLFSYSEVVLGKLLFSFEVYPLRDVVGVS